MSIILHYHRNLIPSPKMGIRFGQHIDPAGEYMNCHNPGKFDTSLPNYEHGIVKFKNPLVVRWESEEHPYDHEKNSWGWKSELHKKYGKTGKELSDHIKSLGYDAIIAAGGSLQYPRKGPLGPATIDEFVNLGGEKQIVKSEELEKHDWMWQDTKIKSQMPHGIIHPSGKYIELHPGASHFQGVSDRWIQENPFNYTNSEHINVGRALNHGWAMVGHAGENELSVHEDVLKDRTNPVYNTLRGLAQHYIGGSMRMRIFNDRFNFNLKDIDPESFHKHGAIKEYVPYIKDTVNKSEELKKEMLYGAKINPELHGLIDPKGNFIKLGPKDYHADFLIDHYFPTDQDHYNWLKANKYPLNTDREDYEMDMGAAAKTMAEQDGWIHSGIAGQHAFDIPKAAQNLSHPATQALRSRMKQYSVHPTFEVEGRHFNTNNFVKYGRLDSADPTMKSEELDKSLFDDFNRRKRFPASAHGFILPDGSWLKMKPDEIHDDVGRELGLHRGFEREQPGYIAMGHEGGWIASTHIDTLTNHPKAMKTLQEISNQHGKAIKLNLRDNGRYVSKTIQPQVNKSEPLEKDIGMPHFKGLGVLPRQEQQVMPITSHRQKKIAEKTVLQQYGQGFGEAGKEHAKRPGGPIDILGNMHQTFQTWISAQKAKLVDAGMDPDKAAKIPSQMLSSKLQHLYGGKDVLGTVPGQHGVTTSLLTRPKVPPKAFVSGQHAGGHGSSKHEAIHLTFDNIRRQHGDETASAVASHLVNQIDPKDRANIHSFLNESGYNTKALDFNEEILAHLHDILTESEKKDNYRGYHTWDKPQHPWNDDKKFLLDMVRHKAGWKRVLDQAHKITPDFINQNKDAILSGRSLAASEPEEINLKKAIHPKAASHFMMASSPASADIVNHEKHIADHTPLPEDIKTELFDSPKQHENFGYDIGGIGPKHYYDYRSSNREPQGIMLKPYHGDIVREKDTVPYMQHPIKGWATLTTKGLFDAAGLGHLAEEVYGHQHEGVPITVHRFAKDFKELRTHPDVISHFQEIGDHSDFNRRQEKREKARNKGLEAHAPDVMKMAVMDFLTNNVDRHVGNILAGSKRGNIYPIVGIDHERNFQYHTPVASKHSAGYAPVTDPEVVSDYIHSSGLKLLFPERAQIPQVLSDVENVNDVADWWKQNHQNIKKEFDRHLESIKNPQIKQHIADNFNMRHNHLTSHLLSDNIEHRRNVFARGIEGVGMLPVLEEKTEV